LAVVASGALVFMRVSVSAGWGAQGMWWMNVFGVCRV